MELKKNPKADLNRSSGLYFVIGLSVVLFTTWRLLELKTYEEGESFTQMIQVADTMDEEAPMTERLRTAPPPPPPQAPTVIEIAEDFEEVQESVIESTESSQEMRIEDAVVSLEDIEVGEEVEEEIVPFAVIENAPVFPGCEDLASEEERRVCFNASVQKHIKDNFIYPESALEMGLSGRVFVTFVIGPDGRVTGIRQRGPDRILEKEAVRIISLLPKMKPGKQRGKPARVNYSIPITFKMQDI